MTSSAAEMAPLIQRVRELLAPHRAAVAIHRAPADLAGFARERGFAGRGQGVPEVILAEDTALELGHPETASLSVVLTTFRPGLVDHGRITLLGPNVSPVVSEPERLAAPPRLPFAQIVLLAFRPGPTPDPFELESTQYLTHRLPGYMVRAVPGRLWARLGRQGRAAGLDLVALGSALVAAYLGDFAAVSAVEVVLVTSSRGDVEQLGQVATEAAILSGHHKKLVLAAGGEVECPDLDCEHCAEKAVCDGLRDVIIRRRSRTGG